MKTIEINQANHPVDVDACANNAVVSETIIEVVEIRPMIHEVQVQPTIREAVEVSPVHLTEKPVLVANSWVVLNIDRDDATYFYLQYMLHNTSQYRIQRINKTNYEIGWNTSTQNSWNQRKEISYE